MTKSLIALTTTLLHRCLWLEFQKKLPSFRNYVILEMYDEKKCLLGSEKTELGINVEGVFYKLFYTAVVWDGPGTGNTFGAHAPYQILS